MEIDWTGLSGQWTNLTGLGSEALYGAAFAVVVATVIVIGVYLRRDRVAVGASGPGITDEIIVAGADRPTQRKPRPPKPIDQRIEALSQEAAALAEAAELKRHFGGREQPKKRYNIRRR